MKITIIGDSWACGQWGDPEAKDKRITAKGFAGILKDLGHSVDVQAWGPANNKDVVDTVVNHRNVTDLQEEFGPRYAQSFDSHSLEESELIIWSLTDPFRDFPDELCFDDSGVGIPVKTVADYTRLQRDMLTEQMDLLHSKRPEGVALIGGVMPVPEDVATRYPGWRVIVADLTRWLIPTAEVSGPHLCRGWDHVKCDADLQAVHDEAESRAEAFKHRAEHDPDSAEHKWFWPNGRHPNQLAHERLAKELIIPLVVDKS